MGRVFIGSVHLDCATPRVVLVQGGMKQQLTRAAQQSAAFSTSTCTVSFNQAGESRSLSFVPGLLKAEAEENRIRTDGLIGWQSRGCRLSACAAGRWPPPGWAWWGPCTSGWGELGFGME